MKLFDVTVYNANQFRDVVYQTSLTKKNAKKLVSELKSKGFKAQYVTSKDDRQASGIVLEAPEREED